MVQKEMKADPIRNHKAIGKNKGISNGARRPWGSWEVLNEGEGFKIKFIEVLPHQRLSLQKHKNRSEHWVILEGQAKVINKDKVIYLDKNNSIWIEKGSIHRLENIKDTILKVIEVQLGDHLEEDDIERLEDDYGRKANE